MPELPEVETMVRDLRQRVVGRTILTSDVYWDRLVGYPTVRRFRSAIKGKTILRIRRRGKFALFGLDDESVLAIHRGMTGALLVREAGTRDDRFVRARFRLDDKTELRFDDARKFGRLFWHASAPTGKVSRDMRQAWTPPWDRLGVEPLSEEFTVESIETVLRRRKVAIKTVLLDQTVIAGIGNIYADESLFLAGIHPARPALSLAETEIAALWASIISVLLAAIDGRGTTFLNYQDINGSSGGNQQHLMVFHREPGPCDRCGGEIRKILLGARGTHYCVGCQH